MGSHTYINRGLTHAHKTWAHPHKHYNRSNSVDTHKSWAHTDCELALTNYVM